ncbi:MAG: DUF2512 family protein [Bacillota bacterium]|nr:DUF2512 family protein [Bacillota bacterium]
MSKTATALIVKFLMTAVFGAIVFRPLGNSWGWILTVGMVGTALNYLLGDLAILPSLGNVAASLGDGLLAALTAHVTGWLTPAFFTTFSSLLLFAVLIAVGEYFFHLYLLSSKKVAP